MKYTYYPGCSLAGLGKACEESLLEVLRVLDVATEELPDWNCCGATAYMAVDESKAFPLAARNLALAEKRGLELMAPCSACYLVLSKTQAYMREYPEVGKTVRNALAAGGLTLQGEVTVRHPLDILVNDVGLEAIKSKARKPLKGLKVAPYYGCQLVRPYSRFDHQVYPVTMDNLLKAVGADVVHYPVKTKCCGGSLTGTLPEVGVRLSYNILREAKRQGADLIATVCPLCVFNLDSYQDKMKGEHWAARRKTESGSSGMN